jgi:hypothetical protein
MAFDLAKPCFQRQSPTLGVNLMVTKFAVLSCAVAVVCAFSFASVPAHSVPLASLKADSNVMLVKKDGGGKNWSKKGGNKNWSKKGGNRNWSGKGHGGKKWTNYGRWHGGQHYRGGYWRNGIFVTLPFIVGDQCYDYLDWSDGVRPGWYWVC